MAQTLSFSPLSLNLPSSRMSIDFSTLSTDFSTLAIHQSTPHKANTASRRPEPYIHRPSQHRAVRQPLALPELKEESESVITAPAHQKPPSWLRRKPVPDSSEQSSLSSLSRKTSTSSTQSTNSSATTLVSSVFSSARSDSTTRTSASSSLYSNPFEPPRKEATTLDKLPLSLLEHVIEYTLCLPLTVSIGPQDSANRHMQHRYHRAGLDYMDIQLILNHPIFLVSRHVREVALDVFHRRCDFVIDLHRIYHSKVSSTINENLKKHQRFWLDETPKMVRDSLQSLSRLYLRLPVPSTEAGIRRGRDETDWMDGSDGKGGGNWRVKSMKKEQEDAAEIQKCLEAIKELVMTDPGSDAANRPRASSLSHSLSIRRTKSGKNLRSKSVDYVRSSERLNPYGRDDDDKRKPLKRLELVLVKRSSHALVLPESLDLIRTLRSVPVTGFTKYYFELEGQKVAWATKYRKKWQGMEPDATRFLDDLRGLAVADKPIEPIQTPTQFQFVEVSRAGQLQLSESVLAKNPIVLEKPVKDLPDLPFQPISKANGRRWPWKKHGRKDSFTQIMDEGMDELGSSGTETSGRYQPPTVEELRKIADDIRNGLY
ncbi:hypothetical protein BS50DRAFT_631037 [Corynespora cassiicola Philippines]|uniref:F-box domain-containing protein n=1 Tax=Corynespora cassiicola Philippines TaxID=1448308 RepID=A0A2T2NZZ8_CORCC|nr:hypothetical protein BS50DRAFT_631037 [Corynespora cassiicola Philippines]